MSQELAQAVEALNTTVSQIRQVVEGMPDVMKGAVAEALVDVEAAQKTYRRSFIQNADVEADDEAFEAPATSLAEIRMRPARTDAQRELQRLSDSVYTRGTILRIARALNAKRDPRDIAIRPEEIPGFAELQQVGLQTRAINSTNLSEMFPTEYSYQLVEDIRTEMKVAGLFQQLNVPRSPYTWPVRQPLSGRSYIISANSNDTPENIGTRDADAASVTFTTRVLGVRTVWDKQFDEDSIIDLEAYTRDLIVRQLTEDLDEAIISGDTTATHLDSSLTIAADDPRRLFKGLRKLVREPSTDTIYDTTSTSGTGTAAYTAGDIQKTRKLMGKYGLDPRKCALIQSISAYYMACEFTEVKTLESYGPSATILNGQLANVWGIPIIVSEKVPETLDASGLNDGSSTNTVDLLVNRMAYALATQRGITLETDYTPRTQQLELVGSMRVDFQPWFAAATEKAVAEGGKISVA